MSEHYINHGIFLDVDWESLIDLIKVQSGDSKDFDFFKRLSSKDHYKDIFNKLNDSKFNTQSIGWINYYPDLHYDSKIDKSIKNWLGLDGIHRSWISRVNPGFYAPWHWDVDDNEQEYLRKGSIKRYSGFLDQKSNNIAHTFVIENEYIFNTEQGEFIYWTNHRSWHAGMNGGLDPKFMYHILGW